MLQPLRVFFLLALCVAAGASSACDSTYLRVTAASNLGVSVTGDWRGTFLVASCPSPFSCGLSPLGPASTLRFDLHLSLRDDGGRVSGTLSTNTWNRAPTTLNGYVRDGVLHLSGRSAWRDLGLCRYAGDLVLHDLQLRATVGTRLLHGDLSFNGLQTQTSCDGTPIRINGSDLRLVAD